MYQIYCIRNQSMHALSSGGDLSPNPYDNSGVIGILDLCLITTVIKKITCLFRLFQQPFHNAKTLHGMEEECTLACMGMRVLT